MEEDILIKLLSNIGVPAALCFYTLFEVNKNMKKLSDSIDRLANDVDKRLDKLEEKTNQLSYKIEFLSKEDSHAKPNR